MRTVKKTIGPLMTFALVLFACLALCACSSPQTQQAAAKVSALIAADGWDKETSSDAVVVFYGQDGKALMSHALACNAVSEFEAPASATAAKIISPINADGSIFIPTSAITIAPESGKTVEAAVELVSKSATDTTADELEAIIKELGEAAKVGDKTMAGDAGKAVIELAKKNATANPNADKENIEVAADKAEAFASSASVREASEVSGQSSEGGSSSGHTHTWATRYVVDSAAWTEEIYHPMEGEQHDEPYTMCTVCGADISADPGGHIISVHSGKGSWSSACRIVTTIYHEAYTEYIEHSESGHTETYCTGCGAVQ